MPDDGAGAAASPPLLALGFDYGARRIGVASGDTLTNTARPLGTVMARAGLPDWARVAHYLAEWRPQFLVVGVPCNMDGTPGPLTDAALGFAAELRRRYALEVATVDERLSSREAEDVLRRQRASGARRRRVRRADVDPVAACVLLEQWLRAQRPAAPSK